MAAQFTLTSTASFRRLRAWTARAIISLPVPVSPVRSTEESVGATCSTLLSTRMMAGDVPMGSCGPAASRTSPWRYWVKCSRRWRSASARRRSSMSRRMMVNSGAAATSARDSVASTGNSSPSARMAVRPSGIHIAARKPSPSLM
jgi:hypothetical protein